MFRPEFALPGMKVSVNHSAKKLIPDSVGVHRSPLNPAGFDRIMWGSVTSSGKGTTQKPWGNPSCSLSEDNQVGKCSEHQQYLVKNLAVKTGDKVKVVWEANEKCYLGIQGKDFGYFPIAHTKRCDTSSASE